MSSKTDPRSSRRPRALASLPAKGPGKGVPAATAASAGKAASRRATDGRERVLLPVPAPVAEPDVVRPRRTQAERSRITRERVMLATVELMRLRGYGDLSTVEVSERAGVSRGAMLHQFPTKNDLVIETMRYLNDRMLEASAARAERARESQGDPFDDIIEDAFDFFFGDYFFITLSISMSDERNETLRQGVDPLVGPARLRIERRWADVLEHAGWPRQQAADLLALTFSLVRGFAVRRLIQDDRKRFDELMALWKSMVARHVRDTAREGPAGQAKGRTAGARKRSGK